MDFMKQKGMNRENLLIVDFLNLCFRYKHANKKHFTQEAINTIRSLGNSYAAKDIIVAGDWGSSWRKSIYPEYKANRIKLKEKQTPEQQKEYEEFLEEANRALETLRDYYTVFKFKGVEADDIAAYICGNYKQKYSHVWLISSDKDWDLLVKPNVSRFSYVTRKEITWENWQSHYDCTPDEYISIKVLQGDTGDNIPGVEGIGPKRALILLNSYDSAYDIYANIPIDGTYKYIQNLNDFKENILLNYKLMDIETNCDTAIGKENIKSIEEVMHDQRVR